MEREIFADGRAAGTLRTEPDGADTCFSLSCRLGPGLWRLWAEGTAGRLLLGTLEGGGPVTLRRRFSDRLVRPVGTVVRGLAEEVGAARADAWRPAREVPSFPAAAALPGGCARGAGRFGLARGGSLRGGCPLPADGAVLSRADRNGRRAAVRGVRLRRVRLARPARRFREAIKNSHLVYHLPPLYDIIF